MIYVFSYDITTLRCIGTTPCFFFLLFIQRETCFVIFFHIAVSERDLFLKKMLGRVEQIVSNKNYPISKLDAKNENCSVASPQNESDTLNS